MASEAAQKKQLALQEEQARADREKAKSRLAQKLMLKRVDPTKTPLMLMRFKESISVAESASPDAIGMIAMAMASMGPDLGAPSQPWSVSSVDLAQWRKRAIETLTAQGAPEPASICWLEKGGRLVLALEWGAARMRSIPNPSTMLKDAALRQTWQDHPWARQALPEAIWSASGSSDPDEPSAERLEIKALLPQQWRCMRALDAAEASEASWRS